MAVQIGKIAPSFSAFCDDGSKIDLSELRGKNVVLYFYPKDDTPGCTIEAQDFTNNIEKFVSLNTVVLGVSRDSVKRHCNFIQKYNLAFNLISDEDSEVCSVYGVLKEKSMFGKKYLGIDRSTFIVDKKGDVVAVWDSVKVKGHVDEVLKFLEKLEA
ncbi:MAG: peroxiredoxin Q/BCP [Rickettsiales bacterium]|jgi:peroxiredoxin Q/BCP